LKLIVLLYKHWLYILLPNLKTNNSNWLIVGHDISVHRELYMHLTTISGTNHVRTWTVLNLFHQIPMLRICFYMFCWPIKKQKRLIHVPWKKLVNLSFFPLPWKIIKLQRQLENILQSSKGKQMDRMFSWWVMSHNKVLHSFAFIFLVFRSKVNGGLISNAEGTLATTSSLVSAIVTSLFQLSFCSVWCLLMHHSRLGC